MNKDIQAVEAFFKSFIETYLVERNKEKAMAFFSQDVFSLGIEEFEAASGFQELEDLIEQKLAEAPIPFTVEWKGLWVNCLTEPGAYFAAAFLQVSRELPGASPLELALHITATIARMEGGGWQLRGVHTSAPLLREYPLRFNESRLNNLHIDARQKVMDLLNESVPGGMIGSYYKEGLPLYFVNDQLLATLGYDSYEEFVQDINGMALEGIHPADREYVCQAMDASLKENSEYQAEYRMLKKDGSYIWVMGRGKLLEVNGKQVIVSLCLDISESVHLQQRLEQVGKELRRKAKELSDMADKLPGGICTVRLDADFTLLYGNEEFYEMYGYTPSEMRIKLGNRLIAVIHPDDTERIIKILQKTLAEGQSKFEFEKRVLRPDGKIAWMLAKGILQETQDGEELMHCVVLDISGHKAVEEQLRINEARLQVALEHTENTVFDYDIKNKRIIHPGKSTKLYNLPHIIENMPESFVEREVVHPEYAQDFLRMYQEIQEGEKTSSCVVKIRNADGKYYWNRISLINIFDEDGEPSSVIGISENITDEKEMELAFLKEEQYRQAMLTDTAGYFEANLTRDILERCSGSRELSHQKDSYQAYVDAVLEKEVHLEDQPAYKKAMGRENILAAFQEGEAEVRCEYRAVGSNGRIRWMMTVAHLIADQQTGDVRMISYIRDIDQQKRESLKLRYQSERDSLTGLYNKKIAEALIQEQLSIPPVKGNHMLLIIDVDNFKQVNDVHGHLYGDRVLSEMAKQIRQHFRGEDIVGRLGGDEFVVLMKNITSWELAAKKARDICAAFRRSFEELSCSIGIAAAELGDVFEQVYKKADVALYQAKENGRNQYVFYQQSKLSGQLEVMLKESEQETGEKFCSLPEMILENLDDVVYVSDADTYQLLYLNAVAREQLGILGEEYVGEKCYKVLQGRSSPCSFCTNQLLREGGVYAWQHDNSVLRRKFFLQDKLITWNGCRLRMEIAVDLAKIHALENTEFKIRLLAELSRKVAHMEDMEELFAAVGEAAGGYYHPQSLAIIVKTQTGDLRKRYEWTSPGNLPLDNQWNQLDVEAIQGLFEGAVSVQIPNVAKIKEKNPFVYKELLQLGAGSLFMETACLENMPAIYMVMKDPMEYFGDTGLFRLFHYILVSKMQGISMKRELHFLDKHDLLTGLANWESYASYAHQKNFENLHSMGMITADINGLKKINQQYGHGQGDKTVKDFAVILTASLPEEKIFRLGGDEFVICLENMEYQAFMERLEALRKEITATRPYSVSFGYAWAEGEIDLAAMAGKAEELMFIEKQKYYQESDVINKHYRPVMLRNILEDIRCRRYEIYLQPKADIHKGKIVGAEALIRYNHPEMGHMPPGKFIPLLEEQRLIRYIDLFVFEEVCRLLERWKKEGRELMTISLNFSRITLLENNLLADLQEIMKGYDVDSRMIEIEITETVGEMGKGQLAEISREFKRENFQLSLDDFGTKYTNISMLAVMQFDKLKLDRSLVESLQTSSENQIIVECVVEMCRRMGVSTIAEGVETPQQKELLQEIGCDQIQGYLISKPVPVPDFEKMLDNDNKYSN